METIIDESKQVMGLTLNLDRDELIDLICKIRASLPEDLRKASRVTAESERIVVGAREAAEQTVVDAQSEAQRVLVNAQNQAEKMVRDAESKAQHRLQEADSLA